MFYQLITQLNSASDLGHVKADYLPHHGYLAILQHAQHPGADTQGYINMIHTVSTWLTLSLAIWRFIMIKFPTWPVSLCTGIRCKLVLTCGYVVPVTFANFDGSDFLFSLNFSGPIFIYERYD